MARDISMVSGDQGHQYGQQFAFHFLHHHFTVTFTFFDTPLCA